MELHMVQPAPQSFAARYAKPPEKTKRSHVDEIIARSGHLIHKLKAKDTTGRWAYYFVYVESSKERAFLAAIGGDGTIDLEHFGRVIASCYGETPTDEIRAFLKERYGFDV
jgi:hypothetical protein